APRRSQPLGNQRHSPQQRWQGLRPRPLQHARSARPSTIRHRRQLSPHGFPASRRHTSRRDERQAHHRQSRRRLHPQIQPPYRPLPFHHHRRHRDRRHGASPPFAGSQSPRGLANRFRRRQLCPRVVSPRRYHPCKNNRSPPRPPGPVPV